MKFKLNRKYVDIGIHVTLFGVISFICIFIVLNINSVFGYILRFLSTTLSLLSPLFFGLIFAYLLDPLVIFLDRKVTNKKSNRKNRFIGTLIAYILVIMFLFIISYSISLNFKNNTDFKFSQNIIDAIEEFMGRFDNVSFKLNDKLSEVEILKEGEKVAEDIISLISFVVKKGGNQIIAFFSKLGGYLINIFIGIVISFYLLMDKEYMLRGWNRFLDAIFSKSVSNKVRGVWKEIDSVLSGYIRGQLLDVLIMGILISVVLLIIGIDFAVVIGIISGFANLIPMIGSTVATIIAVALAGDTPIKALYSLIALIILQQIDGNIIVPKIVGKNVKLHPLMVLLAIFIFGSLFGILGMIVAVPVMALIKHFYIQYINYRLEKYE